MKKIIQWLSGGVIKEIGNVIDKLTTTEEEKLEIKKQVAADRSLKEQAVDVPEQSAITKDNISCP